ncbi:MAG: hypothetical protein ACLR5B_04710 [Blautia sp.]
MTKKKRNDHKCCPDCRTSCDFIHYGTADESYRHDFYSPEKKVLFTHWLLFP